MARTTFSGPVRSVAGFEVAVGTPVITPAGALRLGATGTPITQMRVYVPSLTPTSVAAATVAQQTFSVPGLAVEDIVVVNGPAPGNATGIANVRVSATDTLAIAFVNPTAGALVPTAGVYTVLAVRR